MIILTTGLSAILIVLYSIYSLQASPEARFNFLPNYYEPVTSVRILDEEKSTISSVLGDSSFGLLATLAGASPNRSSSSDLAQRLLVGHRVLDDLIEEFEIIDRFSIVENPRTSARSLLREAFKTDFDPATGMLTISFKSVDKYFATEILASAVSQLEGLFDELNLRRVLERKRFLQESIASHESELKAAQQALINFQARNNIIDIKTQTEYQLSSLANLDGQILVKETELSALLESRRPEDPAVLRTQMQLNLLRTRRDAITLGQRDKQSSLEIPLAQLPELSAIYTNLVSDIEILQVIYSTLRSQYETVKIEERNNSELFQVIEQAEVPELKAGPSRGKISIVVTLSAFLLSVLFAFFAEYMRRAKTDPVESEKLAEIGRILRPHRKK